MTVNDILEKIEELNKIQYSLKDICTGCQVQWVSRVKFI